VSASPITLGTERDLPGMLRTRLVAGSAPGPTVSAERVTSLPPLRPLSPAVAEAGSSLSREQLVEVSSNTSLRLGPHTRAIVRIVPIDPDSPRRRSRRIGATLTYPQPPPRYLNPCIPLPSPPAPAPAARPVTSFTANCSNRHALVGLPTAPLDTP